PQEQVLGHLLGDGAAAAHLAPARIVAPRLFDGVDVEAVVVREPLVFGRHQGQRHVRRHRVQVAPVVRGAVGPVALAPGLELAGGHERRERRVHEAQHRDLEHGEGDAKQRHQPQQAPPAFARPGEDPASVRLRHRPAIPICEGCTATIIGIPAMPATPSDRDTLTRFLLPAAGVRGVRVHLDDTWAQVRERGGELPEAVVELLGEASAAAALFTGHAKVDGRLSVQLRGNGPLRTLFTECTAAGTVRGIAQVAGDIALPRDLRALGQDALLAITIENPSVGADREPVRYQGLVALESESLAGAFEDYFRQSEQLPTRLLLAADDSAAAGLMLQKLPGDAGDDDGWNRAGALFE